MEKHQTKNTQITASVLTNELEPILKDFFIAKIKKETDNSISLSISNNHHFLITVTTVH